MVIKNRVKILIAEKELRESRRLTYRTIAKETGISTSTLTAYINQDVNRFDTTTLETLCAYLNCSLGALLEYIPPSSNAE